MRPADRLLLVACGALILAGPLMAIQELSRWNDARAGAALDEGASAVLRPADVGFRELWRIVVLVLVIAADLLGGLLLARTWRSRTLRPLAGRLLVLLGVGLGLLDVAFLLDHLSHRGGYLARAISVVWLYPIGAAVVAMSAARLSELEEAFDPEERDTADAAA